MLLHYLCEGGSFQSIIYGGFPDLKKKKTQLIYNFNKLEHLSFPIFISYRELNRPKAPKGYGSIKQASDSNFEESIRDKKYS